MYNACTIMYIRIRSQASDWNCSERERERHRQREGEGGKERKREISSCKNKEYKKAKSFIWMFLKNNPHKR